MPLFKSWQMFTEAQKQSPDGRLVFDNNGAPVMHRVPVPRWTKEQAINLLKAKAFPLVQSACRDGWHIHLIDFVQYQHKIPNADECDQIVLDFQKVERNTQDSPKRQKILEMRGRAKSHLLNKKLQAAE